MKRKSLYLLFLVLISSMLLSGCGCSRTTIMISVQVINETSKDLDSLLINFNYFTDHSLVVNNLVAGGQTGFLDYLALDRTNAVSRMFMDFNLSEILLKFQGEDSYSSYLACEIAQLPYVLRYFSHEDKFQLVIKDSGLTWHHLL